ncbi:MAG: CPBP family intramembrane metalloprotease [Clostridiales bacterium]|nr:CPBP family intramembrane metalloprotease [Clostridiales bacterium]
MSYRSRIFVRLVAAPVLAIFVYFVIIFLAAETAFSMYGDNYLQHEGLISLVQGIVGIAVFTVWLVIKKKMIFPSPTWTVGKPYDWYMAIVGGGAMLGIATLYFMILPNLGISAISKALEEYDAMMDLQTASQADLYMYVFALCILIPILEEIIFRGCVMEGMLELGHPYVAIVLSALYFGLMHGQIIQICYAFLSGIVLGIIYYSTKNIVMTILAHSVFNFFGYGMYVFFEVSERADTVLMFLEFLCIPIFGVIAFLMLRLRPDRFPEKEETGDINKMLPGRHT